MQKGFTLIELLVVVLIVGILSAVALPQYTKAVEKSRAAEGITLVRSIIMANQAYYMANGVYSKDIRDLDLEFPGEDVSAGSVPSRQTKNFSCRATNNAGEGKVGNATAICRRVNSTRQYYFEGLPSRPGQIICGFDNAEGEELCKSIATHDGTYYIL